MSPLHDLLHKGHCYTAEEENLYYTRGRHVAIKLSYLIKGLQINSKTPSLILIYVIPIILSYPCCNSAAAPFVYFVYTTPFGIPPLLLPPEVYAFFVLKV